MKPAYKHSKIGPYEWSIIRLVNMNSIEVYTKKFCYGYVDILEEI